MGFEPTISRQSLYQLSHQGSPAGWVQITQVMQGKACNFQFYWTVKMCHYLFYCLWVSYRLQFFGCWKKLISVATSQGHGSLKVFQHFSNQLVEFVQQVIEDSSKKNPVMPFLCKMWTSLAHKFISFMKEVLFCGDYSLKDCTASVGPFCVTQFLNTIAASFQTGSQNTSETLCVCACMHACVCVYVYMCMCVYMCTLLIVHVRASIIWNASILNMLKCMRAMHIEYYYRHLVHAWRPCDSSLITKYREAVNPALYYIVAQYSNLPNIFLSPRDSLGGWVGIYLPDIFFFFFYFSVFSHDLSAGLFMCLSYILLCTVFPSWPFST